MVEVEHQRASGGHRARRLGDHPLEGVADRALVGQAGERVGGGAQLGDREVAQVGQHGRGLTTDRDAPLLVRVPAALGCPTSTEPITSPPTSSGSHATAPGSLPQTSQLSSAALLGRLV